MEIYVEYVIIDNLIINYLILSLSCKLLNISVDKKNKFFSSLVGTLMVLFMPLISSEAWILFCYRMLTGALMVVITKRTTNVKYYIRLFLVFLATTCTFGGVLIMFLSIFGIMYTNSGLIFLNFEIPLSLFILPIFVFYKVSNVLIVIIRNRLRNQSYTYDLQMEVDGKRYQLKGFMDTGNSLIDVDGRPIIVMELKTFGRIFPKFPMQNILLYKPCESYLKNAHYIQVATVNSVEQMLVFDIDKITVSQSGVKNTFDSVSVGVSRKNFADYNVILHKNFC